jgi:hypothetical protein
MEPGRVQDTVDPDLVDVFPVRDRPDHVSLGDEAHRPFWLVAVHDDQGRGTRVLHQVSGRGEMRARFHRPQPPAHSAGGMGWWLISNVADGNIFRSFLLAAEAVCLQPPMTWKLVVGVV